MRRSGTRRGTGFRCAECVQYGRRSNPLEGSFTFLTSWVVDGYATGSDLPASIGRWSRNQTRVKRYRYVPKTALQGLESQQGTRYVPDRTDRARDVDRHP